MNTELQIEIRNYVTELVKARGAVPEGKAVKITVEYVPIEPAVIIEAPVVNDIDEIARAIARIANRSRRMRMENVVRFCELTLPIIKDKSLSEMLRYRNLGKYTLYDFGEALKLGGIDCHWMHELKVMDSVESLNLPGNLRNLLKRKGYKTVSDILSQPVKKVVDAGMEGWIMYLIVDLIDKGLTGDNGLLLDESVFADLMQKMRLYRILLGMDERGKLSQEFKVWFNNAIKGRVYNTDNRPSRKTTVKPFEIS